MRPDILFSLIFTWTIQAKVMGPPMTPMVSQESTIIETTVFASTGALISYYDSKKESHPETPRIEVSGITSYSKGIEDSLCKKFGHRWTEVQPETENRNYINAGYSNTKTTEGVFFYNNQERTRNIPVSNDQVFVCDICKVRRIEYTDINPQRKQRFER